MSGPTREITDFSEHLQEMLAFLRKHRPSLHAVLEPAATNTSPADVPAGLDSTPVFIQPPTQEARPLATFVLGCGDGGLARALRAGARELPFAGPVIVVEPDRSRMLASFIAHDWQDLLKDPLVRFAVGGPMPLRITECVENAIDPLLEHHLGVAVADGEPGEHPGRIREAFLASANQARDRFDAEAVAQAEREAIRLALLSSRGNKAEAARQLGISRAALYEKMAALDV
ncbi:MAG: hypothetical protein MK085_14195, partial [Phycisphaerales bacterium]|nr:hypothetical protein [Phycisphaerales bacterium]